MKQFQFEVKNHNNLIKELARAARFIKSDICTSVSFQIFTMLEDLAELKKITDIIENEYPDAYYYGCQTYGNIFEGKLSAQKTMIVCSVFEYESTKTEIMYIDPMDENAEYNSLEEVWDFCNENEWAKGVELTTSYMGASLLGVGRPISNLREDVQVFGGIAINPLGPNNPAAYVFSKGHKPSDTAALAFVFGGPDLFLDTDYIGGFEGLGKRFTITSCEGNTIRTIDDEPAMNIYRKYLNISQDENFNKNAIYFPLLVEYDGVECVRVPSATDNPDEIALANGVEKGANVRLSYGEKSIILDIVKDKVKSIVKFGPDNIYVYSCAARRVFWGDEEICLETQDFDNVASTVGFYTHGEILRIGNYLHYFNATMVLCFIREGDSVDYGYDIDELVGANNRSVSIGAKLKNYITAVTAELEGQYNSTMRGLSAIYDSMLLIDLEEKQLTQLDGSEKYADILKEKQHYSEKMKHFLRKTVVENMLYQAFVFCDFHTLKARLRYKNVIDAEFIGKELGWFRAQIVVIKRDRAGVPTQLLFTTQVIEDEKRREEDLLKRAITDGLTGLFNRRAFEMDLEEIDKKGEYSNNFVLCAFDVNGLKNVNDTIGHDAGDEMIIACANCIMQCFSAYGKAYRIGGDEFAVVMYISSEELEKAKADFDRAIKSYRGEKIESFSVSCGYATTSEFEDHSTKELRKMADQKMYEAKEEYYKNSGQDRRGRK